MRIRSLWSSCALTLWFYVVGNKTGLRDGVWGGRVSISSLLWHLTATSVPSMLFCWFVFQTQWKIPHFQFPFIRKAQSRERILCMNRRHEANGVTQQLRSWRQPCGARRFHCMRAKGSRSKSVQERHKEVDDASGRKWQSLRGIHENYTQYRSGQHNTRDSLVDFTFLSRRVRRFKRN